MCGPALYKCLVVEATMKPKRDMVFKWNDSQFMLQLFGIDNDNLALFACVVVDNGHQITFVFCRIFALWCEVGFRRETTLAKIVYF